MLKKVPFRLTEEVEASDREVRDYYGSLITAKGAPVRTLTLEGLNQEDEFILVTTDFEDEEGDFRNTAMAMVEAYGTEPDPLPIVVATRSAIWIRPRDFREGGLEFDSGLGPYQVDLDVNNASTEGTMFGIVKKSKWNWGGCIAFARGKNDHLPCTPCEVYPEVQKLWMGWVDRLIDAGVDGVDLRISAHGSLANDAYEYGFNEPILEEYQKRFGADLLGDGYDLERLSQLRGEHYTAFVRQASQRGPFGEEEVPGPRPYRSFSARPLSRSADGISRQPPLRLESLVETRTGGRDYAPHELVRGTRSRSRTTAPRLLGPGSGRGVEAHR